MTQTTKFPKIIYAFWMQGRANAPELVKINFDRWERLNPDYKLIVFDKDTAQPHMQGFSFNMNNLEVQAFSDILRLRLLRQTGGLWTDASAYPVSPLSSWLNPRMTEHTFFAYKRLNIAMPVDNWFMAACPNCLLVKTWLDMIERYWFMERTPITKYPDTEGFPDFYTPADIDEEMGLLDMRPTAGYPYFWSHHLFSHLLCHNSDFAAQWGAIKNNDYLQCFLIDRLHTNKCPVSQKSYKNRLWWQTHKKCFSWFEIPFTKWLLSRAPVHKLNWRRKSYPLDMLKNLPL